MSAARRAVVVLAALLVSLALVEADARPRSPRPADKKPAPRQRLLADRLAVARQAIAKASWKEAARLLQGLLDADEDAWLQDEGVGLRRETQRLLSALPPEGRKAYRELADPAAARLLAKARTGKEDAALRQVVERYLFTDSGPEALALLARRQADAGHPSEAAPAFALLLEHRASADWPAEDLYRAARAFRNSDDSVRAEQMTRLLLDRLGRDTLRLGGRKLGRNELLKELAPAADTPPEWSLYRGDPRRTGQALGNVPFFDFKWHVPATEGEPDSPLGVLITKALKVLAARKQPPLTAFHPITAVGINGKTGQPVPLVVCRHHGGVMAINARTGSLIWRQAHTWSLESLLASDNPDGGAQRSHAITSWLEHYRKEGYLQIVLENSLVGSLSADSHFVYAIADLAVPPPPHLFEGPGFPGQDSMLGDEEMSKAVRRSVLYAYNLGRGGAIEWQLGGKGSELADCLFLGPPLPLDGKLYLLVEKQREIRLVCVDPTAPDPRGGRMAGRIRAKVLWVQTLDRAEEPLWKDVSRRMSAVPLAFADGVLVCPTYLGSVVGVDPLRKRLLWKYTYKQADKPKGKIPTPGGWMLPTPVVSGGKVLFTAPDTRALHCLSLREGARLWTRLQKEDDLYLAGVKDGRALVVTRKGMRGLSLASGATAWAVSAGLPSGEGALVGRDYYLPVQEHGDSRKPGIVVIDAAAGRLLAFVPMQKRRGSDEKEYLEAPGNLLFTQGLLLSQTPRDIFAYPQAAELLRETRDRLERNAHDPVALMDRAVLQLSRGDATAAIEDLRKVLEQKPSEDLVGEANAALYEALTDLVRRDFDRAEPYLKLYEDVCTWQPKGPRAPFPEQVREHRRRLLSYHLLVGQGRERQGRLRDSLRAYLAAQERYLGSDLMTAPEDPGWQLGPHVWLRRQLRRLLEKATPAQRKELEEEVARQRPGATVEKLESLRQQALLLAPETAAGSALRLRLARQLMAAQAHVEADLLLQEVRRHGSTEQAAQAVHLLAELMLARSLPADAAHYYRLLRRDFAEARLPGGKTGAEVWKDVAADKRLLPYLAEPEAAAGKGRARARLEQEERPDYQPMLLTQPCGEVLPSLRERDVGVVLGGGPRVLLRSRATGEVLWDAALAELVLYNEDDLSSDRGRPEREYRALGTILFLPLGPNLVAVDVGSRRILWKKELLNLLEDRRWQDVYRLDRHLLPERWITDKESGWSQEAGVPPVVGPSVLCVRAEEGLLGLDPRTGKALWKRTDGPRRASLFGDESYVCLVEKDDNNRPVSTRVFRTADGSPVAARDFAALYGDRLAVRGSRLLLGGREGDKVTLRLHDAPAGKDVWRHSYPAGTLLLRSTAEDFTGSVSPKGVVSVLDAATGKEVLHGEMEAEHLRGVEAIHLLADTSSVYLACSRPLKGRPTAKGGVFSVLAAGSGLWSVPINGWLYAFDRAGKRFRWRTEVAQQRVVMNHFAENPWLLLAAYSAKRGKPPDDATETLLADLQVIDKRTGRVAYEKSSLSPEGFHTLLLNAQKGRLDFVGRKSRLTVEWKKAKDT